MDSFALRRLIAAVALVTVMAVGCGGADQTADTNTEAESPASSALPDVGGTLVSGGQFELNELAGQDVVLWFWAPW